MSRRLIAAVLLPAAWLPAQDADSMRAFKNALDERLQAHAFFRRIAFECDERHPPFLFYVQSPPKADPTYVRRVVDGYLPLVRGLLEAFEATYAVPLGLQRHGQSPGFALAILNSRGMYDNYAQVTETESLHGARAHYDPFVRIAVSYQDTFSRENPDAIKHAERHAICHEMTHALQHAYSSDARMPMGLWFSEGLAEYLARLQVGDTAGAAEADHDRLELLAAAWSRPEIRHHLSSVEELVQVLNYDQIVRHARERAMAGGLVMHDDDLAMSLFYAQAATLVRYLHEGGGEARRQQLMACMRALMRGATNRDALTASFGSGPDRVAVDAGYRAWLAAEIRARTGLKVEELAPLTTAETPAEQPAAPPPVVEFDPAQLEWRADESDLRLRTVAQLCAQGDYDLALQQLGPDDARTSAPTTTRLARERRRVAALIEFRDRVVADLTTRRTAVQIALAGTTTDVRIEAREGDHLRIDGGSGPQTVPIAVLGPDQLLRHGWRRRWLTGEHLWLDRWLRWLSGTTIDKLRPLLSGNDQRLADLRLDLLEPLDPARELGSIAADLGSLRRPLPEERTEALRLLESLRRLVREHGNHPLVASRSQPLLDAARILVDRAVTLADPSCLGLTGRTKTVGSGGIEVTYEGGAHAAFDAALIDGYMERFVARTTGITHEGPATIRRGRQCHELVGAGYFRWPLPLEGRQVIEFDQSQSEAGLLEVVFCDDGEGSYLQGSVFGLTVVDRETLLLDRLGTGERRYYPDRTYRVRIEHDGKDRVVVTVDGQIVAECNRPGTRTSGYVGFNVFSSNPIRVQRLVIEGTVSPRALPDVKQRLIDRIAAELRPAGK